MKSDTDEVALQGIEFWSNVSDEEMDLSIEATEATESGRVPARTSRFYAKGALQYLVPVLVQKLTKQVRLAAGTASLTYSRRSLLIRRSMMTRTTGIQAKPLECV